VNSRRRVCVVVGSRANYSSIKSAMCAIRGHRGLELQVVVMASALLNRFGSVVDLIERDGFAIAARASVIVEGETPVTMAKSTGLGLVELPTIFDILKPDVVVSVGDRFETMATAIAAAYMNIPLEPWLERIRSIGASGHQMAHFESMAKLHQDNRYDRSSGDVELLTGVPPMSIEDFVRMHQNDFTKAPGA